MAYAADDFKTAIAEYDVVATKLPESPFAPYRPLRQGLVAAQEQGIRRRRRVVHRAADEVSRASAQGRRQLRPGDVPPAGGRCQRGDRGSRRLPEDQSRPGAQATRSTSAAWPRSPLNDLPARSTTFDESAQGRSQVRRGRQGALRTRLGAEVAGQARRGGCRTSPSWRRSIPTARSRPRPGSTSARTTTTRSNTPRRRRPTPRPRPKPPGGELAEKATYKLGWSTFSSRSTPTP